MSTQPERNIKELHLRESEEMKSDREYIERISMLPVLMVRGQPPAHSQTAS